MEVISLCSHSHSAIMVCVYTLGVPFLYFNCVWAHRHVAREIGTRGLCRKVTNHCNGPSAPSSLAHAPPFSSSFICTQCSDTLREVKDYLGPILFLVESYKPEYFFWEVQFESWHGISLHLDVISHYVSLLFESSTLPRFPSLSTVH